MEHQRDLSSSIFGDEDNKEWLIAEGSQSNVLLAKPQMISVPHDFQNVRKFNYPREAKKNNQASKAKLSEIQQQVLNQIKNGSSEAEILADFHISRRTYFRIISKAKAALGVSTSLQLGLKSFE
jgi:DNA-binding NarL/FixJ family response regulator